ncbi:hypothetical protein TeGR_g13641, partial [Tetraparma gracilis]
MAPGPRPLAFSSSPDGSFSSPAKHAKRAPSEYAPGMGLAIVLMSAGLVMYAKRGQRQVKAIAENQMRRRPPEKAGPKSRLESERSKNRWEKDD